MRRMAEPDGTTGQNAAQVAKKDEAESSAGKPRGCNNDLDRMICERCGKAEMYRMHAVWRCPECGFKTDCCGW
jgi:predicted RNA-binding Zn-ribbon protein involved in translation (DUF1610 family)